MKHVHVSAQARVASFSLSAFACGLVYGFLIAPAQYKIAPFRTLMAVMPVGAWAALWAFVAVVMAFCAITRSGIAWIVGSTTAIFLASCWLVGLMFQWAVNRTPLSPAGIALWSWFVFTLLLFVRSPRQFDRTV